MENLPMPRMAPLLRGLGHRYLETGDNLFMHWLEDLLNGMKLDEGWILRNLDGPEAALNTRVRNAVREKYRLHSSINDQEENFCRQFLESDVL
ncbi:cbcf8a3d-95f8-4013-ab42-684153b2d7f2 [Thermothielavioides terrestris]|uniref:Cbcf8a3d-95f8-4013-ab42-684153b2d7f2 n=1 Tax=Thermothielavioides terrestris TaxID=2587410 RepID=A0A3S4EZE0_9PEZI|nr:cbcf8a3d-95f8-4013-ab42-684153b2d7f2 [Thermothielavioides terrestris]